MIKKLVAPVALSGALLAGLAVGGTAFAATPTTAVPVTAHVHHHNGAFRAWWKANRKSIRTAGLDISAKAIGVTPQALATELRTGKSIAQVAGEHNVPVATVVGALTAALDAKVSAAVTAGTFTPARGAAITAKLQARIDRIVNHVF